MIIKSLSRKKPTFFQLYDYMKNGAENQETNNLHLHLMISSNPKNKPNRRRLSKEEFSNIQKEMEIYKNKTFPEMEQEIIYTKERELEKTYQTSKSKDREYRQKHRTKEPSRNDIIKQITGEILTLSYSKTQFIKKLKQHKLELYQRGKTAGIIDLTAKEQGKTKCKHRFKTLGLETEYENLMEFEKSREIEEKELEIGEREMEIE
jgi:hypothetical protein